MVRLLELVELVELVELGKLLEQLVLMTVVGNREMRVEAGTQSPSARALQLDPTQLLILQATPFCNINCSYCYLPARTEKASMSPEVLSRIARAFFRNFACEDHLTLCWHAGEPLVLPASFYSQADKVFRAECPESVKIRHAFQTNGMLVSDDHCRFFREVSASVGVSIDGPELLNDSRRVSRSGKGTFKQAVRGIRKLQEWNIPFHVIMVITEDSISQPELLVDFLEEYSIESVALNMEEVEGPNARSSLQGDDEIVRAQRFYERFFSAASHSFKIKSLRELNNSVSRLKSAAIIPDWAFRSNDQVHPGRIVSVDVTGNWSTFSPELLGWRVDGAAAFDFGNLASDEIFSPGGLEKLTRVWMDIARGVVRCKEECAFFSVCGGGAPSNKFFEHGTFSASETSFCRLTQKSLFSTVVHMLGSVERSLSAAETQEV